MSTKAKKKIKRSVTSGVVHIQSTFNNTMITVTDLQGNVLGWSSAGCCGFKGSRKSTPYAAQVAAEEVGRRVQDYGLKDVSVQVKGPGSGRETALRALQQVFTVNSIRDVTPIPHNGTRQPNRRRV